VDTSQSSLFPSDTYSGDFVLVVKNKFPSMPDAYHHRCLLSMIFFGSVLCFPWSRARQKKTCDFLVDALLGMPDILRNLIQMFQDLVKQIVVRGVLTQTRGLHTDSGSNQCA